jgi:hypothetical protein
MSVQSGSQCFSYAKSNKNFNILTWPTLGHDQHLVMTNIAKWKQRYICLFVLYTVSLQSSWDIDFDKNNFNFNIFLCQVVLSFKGRMAKSGNFE